MQAELQPLPRAALVMSGTEVPVWGKHRVQPEWSWGEKTAFHPERLAKDLSLCEPRERRYFSDLGKEWEEGAHSGGEGSHDHLWV